MNLPASGSSSAPALSPAGDAGASCAAPRVAILIVTYNSRGDILACIDALRSRRSLEIIVLDNHSSDDTVGLLRREHPEIALIEHDANVGFGRGVNLAAKSVERASHLLLINPDAVLRPGAIDALIDLALARPEAGIYGGRMLKADGQLDPASCVAGPSLWQAMAWGFGVSSVPALAALDPDSLGAWDRIGVRRVPVLTAGLLLVSAGLWAALGGFDPRYFVYSEDVDLCLRARRFGATPLFSDACVYVHNSGGSSGSTAARRIGVLTGKATLYRLQLDLIEGWLAIRCLELGVLLRAIGESLVRPEKDSWRAAWRSRPQWRRGWPAV